MPQDPVNEKLIRGIGRWDLTSVVINTIIGAGIFGLPSKVFALIGSYSLYAFVLCAVIVALIMLCFAEVSSRFSRTGGPYLYAREALGSTVAFEVGWLYWVSRVSAFATNCNLMVLYVGFFLSSASDSWARIVIITTVVAALTVVNIIGIRQATMATNLFTAGKLIPLLIFIAVGVFFVHPANFRFGAFPEYSSFAGAVLILIYAFVGFEVAVVPAGEVKDPERDFPFAILVGLAVVAAIFVLVQIVSIGTLPGLATSDRPLADAATSFIGPWSAGLMVIGALISILGNLNVSILGASRMIYAMSERGELPASLAKVDARFRTPHIAVAVTAAIILALTIYSSFLSALTISTITRLFVYATTCLALPVLRRRRDIPTGFRAPFGIGAAIISLILIGWLLTNVDLIKDGIPIIVVGAIGITIYFINLFVRRRKNS